LRDSKFINKLKKAISRAGGKGVTFMVQAGNKCTLRQDPTQKDNYIMVASLDVNETEQPHGSWEVWVAFAKEIILENAEREAQAEKRS
jgi:hypothetical protein